MFRYPQAWEDLDPPERRRRDKETGCGVHRGVGIQRIFTEKKVGGGRDGLNPSFGV